MPKPQQHQPVIVVDAPAAANDNADTSAGGGGESEPSPLPFGAKRPLKSDVWPHFTRFLYVPAPHTSEKLASVLREALMSWNVDYAGKADIQGLETCFSAMTMEDPSCEEFKKEDFQGSQSRTLLDIED
ncbi:unnamed protein product [Linum tenue]|uniref:Uncharacterized protein n=1 Tax=Linum tenue TaxID=586396 RepID=A0AAV0NN18_9ROSI|nr:unnamed protein product [Linum tenue]